MDTSGSATKLFSALLSRDTLRSQTATTLISGGLTLYQNKNYSRALGAFKQAAAYVPDNVDAYNYMAKTYLRLGKTKEAIDAYKISLSIDRTQSDIHQELGNVYFSEKRYTEAEKEFKTAARLDPADNVAPYTLGQLYQQTERYSEAETQFKKVRGMSPKDGNVYYALGSVYNKMGRYDEAVTQLEKAVTLKDDFSYARFELGTAYLQLGDKDKANEQLEILEDLDTTLAATLKADLKQPKIIASNADKSTFNSLLGPGSPLIFLDPDFLEPYSSKDMTMTLQFDSEMDVSSVMNVTNWSITRASGITEGYYNNGVPVKSENEINFSPIPKSVSYDATTFRATVTFSLSQNPYGAGVIDPSHLVFKFSGTDVYGKKMDPNADEYDGFAKRGF
jgi:tetratricopeptide (TPR) repeat protein